MTADPADRRAGQSLDVDLALLIYLEGGVDRDERKARGQPTRVVGVLDWVQQRPSVRPVQQLITAGQVGGDRLAEEQSAAVEADHRLGQHPRVDADRRPEPVQYRGAERSRPDLDSGSLGDQRGHVPGNGTVSRLRCTERQRHRTIRGAAHDDQLILGQRGSAVAARVARREQPGDPGAGRHGGAQPGHLGTEAISAAWPEDHGGYQQVRAQCATQQRGDRREPDGQGPDQPRLNRPPQAPAGHHRAYVGEGSDVQAWVGHRRPAEQQPHPADDPGRLAELGRDRARAADAVGHRHQHPRPYQPGQAPGSDHAGRAGQLNRSPAIGTWVMFALLPRFRSGGAPGCWPPTGGAVRAPGRHFTAKLTIASKKRVARSLGPSPSNGTRSEFPFDANVT